MTIKNDVEVLNRTKMTRNKAKTRESVRLRTLKPQLKRWKNTRKRREERKVKGNNARNTARRRRTRRRERQSRKDKEEIRRSDVKEFQGLRAETSEFAFSCCVNCWALSCLPLAD